MSKNIKAIIQVIFLFLFIALVFMGKIQIWAILFLSSLVLAMFFGRFYCGWMCPINSVMEMTDRVYKLLGIKKRLTPKWMKKPIVHYLILLMFLILFIVMLTTGKKIPVFPILLIVGVVVNLFFVPQFWHRYLCPYGTLLNFTGSVSNRSYFVKNEDCVECGICKKVCNAEAIEMESKDCFPKIDSGLCLLCSNCAKACPKKAIKYRKRD